MEELGSELHLLFLANLCHHLLIHRPYMKARKAENKIWILKIIIRNLIRQMKKPRILRRLNT